MLCCVGYLMFAAAFLIFAIDNLTNKGGKSIMSVFGTIAAIAMAIAAAIGGKKKRKGGKK